MANGTGWVSTSDGRRLRVERRGSGRPIVVFEAGMGASRHTWGAVLDLLGDDVSTVSYDRSGLGESPADPGPRNLERLVSDLVDLLDELGDGPFVLVGHSWGGPIIRRAAERRPERVVGLVLVDVTEETCDLFFSPAAERQTRVGLRLMPFLARVGISGLAVKKLAASLPDASASQMRALDGTVDAARTQQAELLHHIDDLRLLRELPPVLPEVPVTYLTGTGDSRMERGRRPSLIAAHRGAAAALPNGRWVPAEHSTHYVPFTEPDLIAAEIRRIIEDPTDQAD